MKDKRHERDRQRHGDGDPRDPCDPWRRPWRLNDLMVTSALLAAVIVLSVAGAAWRYRNCKAPPWRVP